MCTTVLRQKYTLDLLFLLFTLLTLLLTSHKIPTAAQTTGFSLYTNYEQMKYKNMAKSKEATGRPRKKKDGLHIMPKIILCVSIVK
jgi:hypothetical protein